ncbi:uncharacterized protein LOC101889746 [Musca domestica]|uniref:Uncharacterized protein LOC101889746 n=1 Tax=Musca domestica TaxID=7370 RepID=A0A9J7D6Y9_MUSDO|nr:uncharacterized protein LOC101889746 [Musca domestica]
MPSIVYHLNDRLKRFCLVWHTTICLPFLPLLFHNCKIASKLHQAGKKKQYIWKSKHLDADMSLTEKHSNSPAPTTGSVDDLLSNVTSFIDSVLSSLSPELPVRNDTTSSISPTTPTSPTPFARRNGRQTRRNIDEDIERINRICDTVDRDLRSVNIFINPETDTRQRNTVRASNSSTTTDNNEASRGGLNPRRRRCSNRRSATPTDLNEALIDTTYDDPPPSVIPIDDEPVSNHQFSTPTSNGTRTEEIVLADDDDEVVVVSSNLPTVIDLCTPNNNVPIVRNTTLNRNELTRRNLERHHALEDVNEVSVPPVRRRRVSSGISKQKDKQSPIKETTPDNESESSNHTPFMCPVCMESCLKRRPTSTKCGHVFCEECIKMSIRLTHKCPMCKTRINCSQLIRIYV